SNFLIARCKEVVMSKQTEALYEKTIEVRWADCDANQHMRHSAYSDLCAHTRVAFLNEIGMTAKWFKQHNVGPVLFKEETEYKAEVNIGDELRVTVEPGEPTGFTKTVQMLQNIYKANGELSAVHRCVVGWMDLEARKIIELPEKIKELYLIEALVEV
ncbi:hypothetical protein A3749_26725, partial [Oleiphilus sp. HI0078]